jgi:formylglycine-generating enzyme required for sulfatase activity
VYETVSKVIQTELTDEPQTITWDHPLWSLFMGFEHDRIHFETSSVLFREAPLHLVQKPKGWAAHPSLTSQPTHTPIKGNEYPSTNPMLAVNGDNVQLGKPRSFPSYGWDNEYGTRHVDTPDFSASKYMITNGEYLEFVQGSGYLNEKYWSKDGWGWRSHRNTKSPFWWKTDGPQGSNRFKLRTIFEEIDMPWDAPVCVNHHEAKAYCAWKSMQDGHENKEEYRLPTESEWNLLKNDSMSLKEVRTNPDQDLVLVNSGSDFKNNKIGNSNLAFGSETPVSMLPPRYVK